MSNPVKETVDERKQRLENRRLDGIAAMAEYQADQVALRMNMQRLRALRLAKAKSGSPAKKPTAKRTASAKS